MSDSTGGRSTTGAFFLDMKDGKKYKQTRLYEFKIVYATINDRLGEHYYMCETASHALSSHHGVCLHHDRHLQIKSVHKKNPWTNRWEEETKSCVNLIYTLNRQI